MKRFIGIDIGGSAIKVLSVNQSWKHSKDFVAVATPKNKRAFLKAITSVVESLSSQPIDGIGIGVPGIVDAKRGVLVHAPNLSFLNKWNVKRFFAKYRIPVRVDNDSRCFLRAEAVLGVGRGKRYIAVLTMGTGVGGGLFIDGKVYYGAKGAAGEFGHMVVDRKKTIEELAGKNASASTKNKNEAVGIGIANIINAFDPEIVIMGGGGIVTKSISLKKVRSIAKKFILSEKSKKTPIVTGRFGEKSGALGAALLFVK